MFSEKSIQEYSVGSDRIETARCLGGLRVGRSEGRALTLYQRFFLDFMSFKVSFWPHRLQEVEKTDRPPPSLQSLQTLPRLKSRPKP